MFRPLHCILSILALLFTLTTSYAKAADPIVVNAIVSAAGIQLIPDTIPENTPFIVHVINQAGVPVELENSDTSVEVYADTDKTFKVGLPAGSYVFFNDFNPRSKPATLQVKPADKIVPSTTSLPSIVTAPTPQVSSLKNTEILFVIWRESVEALLVVGVVYGWLNHSKIARKSGLCFLWLGVAAGLLCAVLLSALLVLVRNDLPASAGNIFQGIMALIAAIMILYMVKWMRTQGQTLKSGMQQALEKNASNRLRNISIFTVVAVAFAREATEASVFIYALGFNQPGVSTAKMLFILAAGVLLAIATIYLLQLGNKIFSWKFFFKVTEILLLLLGGGLLLNAVDLLLTAQILPLPTALHTRVWDSSFFIGNGGWLSPMLTSFTGYRTTPSLLDVLVYSVYWLVICAWFIKSSAHTRRVFSRKNFDVCEVNSQTSTKGENSHVSPLDTPSCKVTSLRSWFTVMKKSRTHV